MTPIERTQKWVDDVVIGLNFCPFAAKPFRDGAIKYVLSEATEPSDCFDAVLNALDASLDDPMTTTTLVIFNMGLRDFETYLDVAEELMTIVDESDLGDAWQLATFHPDFMFADTEPSDRGNYTNRSPYPMFHWLAQQDVTAAVEAMENPDEIFEHNIEKLEAMTEEVFKTFRTSLE